MLIIITIDTSMTRCSFTATLKEYFQIFDFQTIERKNSLHNTKSETNYVSKIYRNCVYGIEKQNDTTKIEYIMSLNILSYNDF